MNQTILIGRITKDLELKATPSGKFVCEFSLAVNRIGSEETDFITVVVWEKQAENLAKYQGKGSQIAVSGSIRVDTYEVEGQRRYKTYVLANNIEYLGTKSSETVNKEEPTEAQILNSVVNNEDPYVSFGQQIQIDESDLPF